MLTFWDSGSPKYSSASKMRLVIVEFSWVDLSALRWFVLVEEGFGRNLVDFTRLKPPRNAFTPKNEN
jgi:hypothetical protein